MRYTICNAHPAANASLFLVICLCSGLWADGAEPHQTVQRVGYPIAIDFKGPSSTEADDDPNPFLDYRLQANFTGPDGKEFSVPGFFAGNGKGGASGHLWRVRFSPDQPGTWKYRVSFRRGSEVAVSLDAESGKPIAFDGASGEIEISPRDAEGPGFLKWGRTGVGGRTLVSQEQSADVRFGAGLCTNRLVLAQSRQLERTSVAPTKIF